MRTTRRLTARTALIAAGLVGVTAVAGPASAASGTRQAPAPSGTKAASASPGTQLWARRFHGLGSFSQPGGMAASPDGSAVFATGLTEAASGHDRYATVGYNALTGAKLWRALFHAGPDLSNSVASDVTVSPDSTKVFVTGSTPDGIGTVAYNAATGARLWVRISPALATGTSLAVSPDGSTLFVTGFPPQDQDYVTLAYSTASGTLLWTARYSAPELSFGTHIPEVKVSPDGSTVFVLGDTGLAFATVAYNAATGAQRWARVFSGKGESVSAAMVISPDSSTVYVAGESRPSGRVRFSYATVAYAATTGAQRWVQYDPGLSGEAGRTLVHSIAIKPDGSAVYVTGMNTGTNGAAGYSTIASNAATGAKLWQQRYFGPGGAGAEAWFTGTSPDGATLFVTGLTKTGNYATLGYDSASGKQLWSAIFKPAICATAIGAANPVTPEVMVTGTCGNDVADYITVAYSG
jgi:hypothetical protein